MSSLVNRPSRVSPLARLGATIAIVLGGLAGGLIGFSLVDLQCHDACTVPEYGGGLSGAIFGAVGVGIVSVLTLRAMHEWNRNITNR